MTRTIEMNAKEYIARKKTIWIKPDYTAWSYRLHPTWLAADAPSSTRATHVTMQDTGAMVKIQWYLEKTAVAQSNGAHIYIPKTWCNRTIKCVLLDD